MKRDNAFKNTLIHFLCALSLGIALGLFVYGYWLTDIFPPGSRKLLLFTIAVGLGGSTVYFFLFGWLHGKLATLQRNLRLQVIGLNLILAPFLLFTTTSQWQEPVKYLTFLLPSHQLIISTQPESTPVSLSLNWFNTSQGDISYDTIAYQGWARKDDILVLTDPTQNSLFWSGRTGDNITIVFQSDEEGKVILSWDGKEEMLSLHPGKVTYNHSLAVPWFASRGMILLLGGLNVFVITFALLIIIWPKRSAWMESLKEKIKPSNRPDFNKWEWVGMLGLLLLALALRVFHLGALPPHIEEYSHMNAAKQILSGVPLNAVYQRGLYIVTLPVAGFFSIFGVHIWSARLAGALLNALAVIPLYFMMRKINRPVAILACALFATSPWIIAFARFVREYAYYPFYFYLIAYGMIEFLENFPRGLILSDWRRLIKIKLLILFFLLLIPVVYTLVIDRTSTSFVIGFAYIVFILCLVSGFNISDKKNLLFLSIIMIGLLGAGILLLRELPSFFSLDFLLQGKFTTTLGYFFFNPPQQWYYNRLVIIPVISLISAWVWSVLLLRRNFIPCFFSFLYFISIFTFLFFNFANNPRFFLHIQLWNTILLAIGLYSVYCLLILFVKKKALTNWFLVIGIFATFNVQQVFLPTLNSAPGDMPITEQRQHDYAAVQSYLVDHVGPGDVLLSPDYGRYAFFVGQPKFIAINDMSQPWFADIEKYNAGWIVIEQSRYWVFETLLPLKTFSIGSKQIEYIGEFGIANGLDDVDYLWHWQPIPLP